MMNRKGLALGVALAVGLAGCAADDPHRRAKTGAAVGAITGAILGGAIADRKEGAIIGAAIGGMAGAAIGDYMDKQQREFEAALEEERRQHAIEIERLKDDSLKIDISNEVSFDFDRAEIKPAFRPTLDKVADILKRYDRTVVHVIGHTDSVGSEAYNQRLSERRAEAVADYLAHQGVARERLRTEGRGEREPRADNRTEAGRQLNRRVEIIVKPIVEGQEDRAYEPPPVAPHPHEWK